MNYLAHAYLSFQDEEVLLGNMISDYVKGKQQYTYRANILKGIKLHRAIDSFTDAHEATKEAIQFFRPAYRLYAGAMVDVVYDHFLATDQSVFANPDALKTFSQNTYHQLSNWQTEMPEKFAKMFPYMQAQDWLFNYQFRWGIQKSLEGVRRRARYIDSSEEAFIVFEKNFDAIQQCYSAFMPQVTNFAKEQLQLLAG
jgi:acyl carrier protein phosphodiesterase